MNLIFSIIVLPISLLLLMIMSIVLFIFRFQEYNIIASLSICRPARQSDLTAKTIEAFEWLLLLLFLLR